MSHRLRPARTAVLFSLGLASQLAACGADGEAEDEPAPALGTPTSDGGGTSPRTRDGGTSEPSTGAQGKEISAAIHDREGLGVSIVTIRCAGDCVDVVAVGEGGNPPYAFRWQDGVETAARSICPQTDQAFAVSVQDTAIDALEFSYASRSATAQVYADVLTCPDTTAPDAAVPAVACGAGAQPSLLMPKGSNDFTVSLMSANGALTDYEQRDGLGTPLTLVREARVSVDRSTCSSLPLAGDAAGTTPTGWDNFMIVEYSPAAGAPVEKRWYYGPAATIVHTPSGQQLSSPRAPTVSGFALDPVVPNPLPFGYAPRELDLMTELPPGSGTFELHLYVVDTGAFGSTSAVWLLPR